MKKKLATSFRRWLKREGSGSAVKHYVGAELYFVREWLEARLMDGMTWENYGKVWVVDHLVPVMLFDVTSEADLKKNMLAL